MQRKGFLQFRNEQADLFSNVDTHHQSVYVKHVFRLYKYICIHTVCVYMYVYKL